MIKTFKNPGKNDYKVHIECPELTFLCPKTFQPDFGELIIDYNPYDRCIELKSLKLYIWSFRGRGIGYEKLANEIYDHIIDVVHPAGLTLTLKFKPRGGITTSVVLSKP